MARFDGGRKPGMPLEVSIEQRDVGALLRLRGELDLDSCDQLEAALDEAEKGGARTVIVDLSSLEFIDSTGLSCLLKAHDKATKSGPAIWVLQGGGQVKRVLELSGLAQHLQVVEELSQVPGLEP